MGAIRSETIKITDHRVRLMNDILQAIKLVKLYCWEQNFHDQVSEVSIPQTPQRNAARKKNSGRTLQSILK